MNEVRRGGPKRKELKAIGISILFLVLGFGVVLITKAAVKIEADSIVISLLLIPVLVYVVISGRLKELKGPGGLEAKFEEVAAESVSPAAQPVEPSEGIQIVSKEGVRALQRKRQELDEVRPVVMMVTLGKSPPYDWSGMRQYMNVLSQAGNFKFVVFVDKEERFAGYMSPWAFKGLLDLPELGDEFINIINEGRLADLHRFPGVVRDTISTRSANAEALREMTKQNLEALVVIDENRRLKGIVERDQVLSKMMLALVE